MFQGVEVEQHFQCINHLKETNIVNLNLTLTIHLKFYYEHPKDFYILEKHIKKIHIIDSYEVEEFNLEVKNLEDEVKQLNPPYIIGQGID